MLRVIRFVRLHYVLVRLPRSILTSVIVTVVPTKANCQWVLGGDVRLGGLQTTAPREWLTLFVVNQYFALSFSLTCSPAVSVRFVFQRFHTGYRCSSVTRYSCCNNLVALLFEMWKWSSQVGQHVCVEFCYPPTNVTFCLYENNNYLRCKKCEFFIIGVRVS